MSGMSLWFSALVTMARNILSGVLCGCVLALSSRQMAAFMIGGALVGNAVCMDRRFLYDEVGALILCGGLSTGATYGAIRLASSLM